MRLFTPENLEAVKDRFAPKLLEIESIGWAAWVRPLTLRKVLELRDKYLNDQPGAGDRYSLQVLAATLCRENGDLIYTPESVESLRDLATWEELMIFSSEISKANRLRNVDVADAEKNSETTLTGDSSSL